MGELLKVFQKKKRKENPPASRCTPNRVRNREWEQSQQPSSQAAVDKLVPRMELSPTHPRSSAESMAWPYAFNCRDNCPTLFQNTFKPDAFLAMPLLSLDAVGSSTGYMVSDARAKLRT